MFKNKIRYGKVVLFVHLLLVHLPVSVLASPTTKPFIVNTGSKPVVDGVLNDAVWSEVITISEFHQTRPEDHGTPTQKTEAQLAREFFLVFNHSRDTQTDESVDTVVILKAASNFQL